MTKDKTKHNCSNCSAFGKHCPHKVNGDPYHYDCGMTVEDIEKENTKLKDKVKRLIKKDRQLTKAKDIIEKLRALYFSPVVTKDDVKRQDEILSEAEQFLREVEK